MEVRFQCGESGCDGGQGSVVEVGIMEVRVQCDGGWV